MSETLETLTAQLHDPDRSNRGQAALQLGMLKDQAVLDLLLDALCSEDDLLVREDITWALVRQGEAAITPLLTLLHHDSPAIRHHAAHVLGKLANARATDALIEALQDTHTDVVTKSAFALNQIGDNRAVPALIALLDRESSDIQSMLVVVFRRFRAASVPLLIEALSDPRAIVRENAADALGAMGAREAVPAMIGLLSDPQWQIRFSAVNALGYLGGQEAKAALQTMTQDPDSRVRTLAPRMSLRIKA